MQQSETESESVESSNMVGIVVQNSPRYWGSKERYNQLLPLVQFRHQAFFIDTQKGVGYDLLAHNGMYLEHSLGYDLGRADKNSTWRDGSNKLKGLSAIKTNANTSVAFGWQFRPWLIPEIKVTMPLTQSQGSQFQASVTVVPLQTKQNTIILQGTLLGADSRYINTYYGVSAQQSMKSGFPQFHSSGGLVGSKFNINWIHQFNTDWGMFTGITYLRLANKVIASPIIEQHNQFMTNWGITYNF